MYYKFLGNISIKPHENTYADTHLTPFIHSFHTRLDDFCPIYLCDYPLIKQYEDIIHNTSLDMLKNVFKRYADEILNKNYFFSHEEFFSNTFLDGRLKYTAELTRQACYSAENICLIMDYHYIDNMMEQWKNLDQKVQSLKSLYRPNDEQIYFVDFMEKLVILDIMNGSFIFNNFIKYENFPFQKKVLPTWHEGFQNVFAVWEHYHGHYSALVSKIPFSDKKYQEFIDKFNVGLDKMINNTYINIIIGIKQSLSCQTMTYRYA